MKTLAVFTGGIGDTLLAGPAFALLREQGPLNLAGNPERLRLLQATGACDAVFDLDRVEFHTVFEEPSPKLREFLGGYDRVIVWMRDDGAIKRSIAECGVERVEVYPGLPPADWSRHASEYFVSCVDHAARPEPRPPVRIGFRAGEAPAEPRHDVLIHPGSGSPKKNWPIQNFVAVAEKLQIEGRNVAWIRGPAEEDLAYPPGARAIQTDSLTDLATTLADARLYIGNDSGVTHLVAATGRPVIAIFGPTNPAIWAPRGQNVRVVSGKPWPSVDTILDATNTESREK